MKRFEKVTIIGVGLIGGSIGLGIKKKGLAEEVVGVFRRSSTLKRALKCRAIDNGTLSMEEGVKGADLIIIATPVSLIPSMAGEAMRYAKKGALITDVGSTKKWIVSRIEPMGGLFVGSHPMAGSEHAGVEFARPDLLQGSPCIVTKTTKTDSGTLAAIVDFWKALGARTSVLSPEAHDRSVALISHLPHIVAFSLAGAVPAKELPYAAEGFKDTTRVAMSDPELWADIFLSNRREISKSIDVFERYLNSLKKAIMNNKHKQVVKLLEKAKAVRDSIEY
jgi:prephenate dehydrogenase